MRLERVALDELGKMPQRATGEAPVEVVVTRIHLTGMWDVDSAFGRAGIVEDAGGLDEQPPTRREPSGKDLQQPERIIDAMQDAEAEDEVEALPKVGDDAGRQPAAIA